MTVVRRHLERGDGSDLTKGVGPERLTPSLRAGRYMFETFMQEPACFIPGALQTAPGGTDLAVACAFTGRHLLYYTFVGDATDAFVPTLASEGGWNWVLTTATLARGVEVHFGGFKDGHPRNFVPSNEDWFARLLLLVDNVSGVDATFGFRKNADAVETLTEVTDIAGLRILGDSSSALAQLQIITNLNNAGSTDYTATALTPALTDAQTIELEVRSIGRVAKFFINGVQYTDTSLTFDSGDVLAPVARLIQATDLATQIKTLAYEAGPIDDRQEGSLLSLAGTTT